MLLMLVRLLVFLLLVLFGILKLLFFFGYLISLIFILCLLVFKNDVNFNCIFFVINEILSRVMMS